MGFQTRLLLGLVLSGLPVAPVPAEDFWFDQAPVRYTISEAADPMSRLAASWARGVDLPVASAPLDFLRHLLRLLRVPEESQVLVFSKTSKQITLITPHTPRAVYFSDDTYVGYVPGGMIEVISTDPVLGPVFHTVTLRGGGQVPSVRREPDCLSCHASARTEGVPGMMVRSVLVRQDGHLVGRAGSFDTTASSPIAERWGGWYVTGSHGSIRHLGNLTATGDDQPPDPTQGANWTTLADRIDVSRYLRPTSDIVALMVLEHQCRMHNLLTKATHEYQRAAWLQRAISPDFKDDDASTAAHRVALANAQTIVAEMLFRKEAALGEDGLQGDRSFPPAFASGAPRDADGRSLKDLRLHGHLFKNRCSYMIHSCAFRSLPAKVKGLVFAGLRNALSGTSQDGDHLSASERKRILAILDATVPDWPASGK